jgi:homopolymeric O-antigen transport system permease protein
VSALVESLRTILVKRELLVLLIARDVKQRYLRSALGMSWIVLQPLLLLLFYTFVFSYVFKVRMSLSGTGEGTTLDYMLFILGGLLPWTAFSEGTNRAAASLMGNAPIITKVAFPVELFPTSAVGASLVSLFVSTSLVMVLLIAFGRASLTFLELPLLALLLAFMALGIGCLLAVMNAFVRDISHIQSFIFSLWLYATPVLYPSTMVPERFRWLLALNPLVPIIEPFRGALVAGAWASAEQLITAAVVSIGVLLVGLFAFARAKRFYAELL